MIVILQDDEDKIYLANVYSALLLALGVVSASSILLQSVVFTTAGVKMTSRLRLQYFAALLRQFKYATQLEKAATCLGVVLSVLSGGGVGIEMAIVAEMGIAFLERTYPSADLTSTNLPMLSAFGGSRRLYNASREENMAAMMEDAKACVKCLAVTTTASALVLALGTALIYWSAVRQIATIRMLILNAVLRQDMSWFDTDKEFNIASTMSENISKLQVGIGEKLAAVSNFIGTVAVCLGISFYQGWELTLACSVVFPLSLATSGVVSHYQTKLASREMESYSKAGKHAEEVLKAIRTVVAFGGESLEVNRYSSLLQPAEEYRRKCGLVDGLGAGCHCMLSHFVLAIAVNYGIRLILRDANNTQHGQTYFFGNLYCILISLYIATQIISVYTPYSEAFSSARGAAVSVFQLINKTPTIDILDATGVTPKTVHGDISLEGVYFRYPSRPDFEVLKNVSIHIKAGEYVALVGSSGCGKSTVLQLLQRLYEPTSGTVRLDGYDVRHLNLNWLRSTFGVVEQEPVLFSGTLFKNIAVGCHEATLEAVQQAARTAHAHDFIQSLPMGYDTLVGERGAQLSGGQKQRVGIARALVRAPRLLLLDEPTSALDPRADALVHAALRHAAGRRHTTTVVVSHRLSTIADADRIICMHNGTIVEQGTHQQLMMSRGMYHGLWANTEQDSLQGLTGIERNRKQDEGHSDTNTRTDTKETSSGKWRCRDSATTTTQLASSASDRVGDDGRGDDGGEVTSTDSQHVTLATDADRDPDDNHELRTIQDSREVSGWQILKLNAPEWAYLVTGAVAALAQGSCTAVIGVIFGYTSMIVILQDDEEKIYLANVYSALLLALGVVSASSILLQSVVFTTAGLKMTSRLRLQYFAALLRQEIGFFDIGSNSVGALCSRLSGDTADVQNATGLKVGIVLQGGSSVVLAFCTGLFFNWKLTVIATAFILIMVGATWLESRVSQGTQQRERRDAELATTVAVEALLGFRTVQSLGIQRVFVNQLRETLDATSSGTGGVRLGRCVVLGMGLFITAVTICSCYWYGAFLIQSGETQYRDIVLVSDCMLFAAQMLGPALVYTTSFDRVHRSTANILAVIRRQPRVYSQPSTLPHLDESLRTSATGSISFNRVTFTYPTRKQEVLRGVELSVSAGQTVALVGASGSGKSTILQLIQRFYDPHSGTIKLDGADIARVLTLPRLRQQLGVVQQEPVLFDRTLAENVAYGNNSRQLDMCEIIAACKTANIHTFITSLPMGYGTRLGAGGAQLSGGQKQRVGIARALVRAPRLLLLDEPTSALDASSQRAVTEALAEAAKGRTCVMIVHRLSEVENADVIFVLHEGTIAEIGKHEELMKSQGLYHQMYNIQNPVPR